MDFTLLEWIGIIFLIVPVGAALIFVLGYLALMITVVIFKVSVILATIALIFIIGVVLTTGSLPW